MAVTWCRQLSRTTDVTNYRQNHPRALTLTLTFAGGADWEKTRRLAEPSAHEDEPRLLAYRLLDAAGLPRGRVTALGSLIRGPEHDGDGAVPSESAAFQ
ncbi:hypothetical protein ACM01_05130 [Streptomyces viridochromogenes]|uniref:Uncharacterized protein n=1 Tax=Streptomyces viridochromogenes TaxID=1938 RepID=A0A0J8CF39_STRVR|nr:hypothetical protein [Streptomyces viridochromogenes]KMS76560.1 hypothetical protein ACM01_05130 [Streptomyces viridochromogenes]KOG23338.1 hypothetical protein ADK35_13790 [Streptomyces viridochromogenes]KOG27056.1 hypothetical protein ADK36_00275 [Streptomyces viridochromogenes]